jgi:NTE family protein
MRPRLAAPFLVLVWLVAAPPRPADARAGPGDQDPPPRRPVTLVLSGGGARGAAHIGVLKVLEELRVPVDRIVGTSMGSIVGGLYATGWSPDEIERLFVRLDFRAILVDHPERGDKSFRRKLDDREFLIPLKLRFKGPRPYIPPAALGGQRLETLLRTLEIESTDARDFDEFPIPYRAVAADLASGEAVVLAKGSLATAMRASMSVAGMFTPVVIDGRRLVDGGSAANVPVGIAQSLGGGAIVAVDITSPLGGEETLGSIFSILDQLNAFLTVGNRAKDIERLRPGDVLILPDLGDIAFGSFERVGEAIGLGEAAARKAAGGLRALSAGAEEYAAFKARHRRRPIQQVVPDEVRLENSSWVDDEVVRRQVHVAAGRPLDVEALNRDIRRLHALEYFGTIRDRFDRAGGRAVLTLETPLKPYGRNSLQLGVNFRDDFRGDAGYALAARHQLLGANRRGGEWQNVAQIGDTTLLDSQLYQPLDHGMRWFVEPGLSSRRWSQSLWSEGQPVAEYRVSVSEASLDAGRVLGRWGETRLGVFYSGNAARLRTGVPQFPNLEQRDGGLRFRFRVDTRDDSIFPERGLDIDATYARTFESLGAETEYTRARVAGSVAKTFGRNTLVPNVEAGTILEGPDTVANTFNLGGLLRLSGLGTDELIGSRYGLASVIYYRELTSVNLGALSPRLYAGASLEIGNTYFEGDPVSLGTLRHSGGLFIGGRTPLGPVYLAFALADGGRTRFYFNIGGRF